MKPMITTFIDLVKFVKNLISWLVNVNYYWWNGRDYCCFLKEDVDLGQCTNASPEKGIIMSKMLQNRENR
jgi:hypothetical protein